jgi:hypothetical protein
VAGCLPPQPGIVFRPLPEGRCAGDTSSHRRTPPPPPGPSPWPYHRRLEIPRVPQAIGTGPWNRDEHGQGFWRGVKVQVVGPPQSKGGPRALGSGGALEVHHGRPTGGAGMKVRGLLCLPLEGWLTGLKSPDALRPPCYLLSMTGSIILKPSSTVFIRREAIPDRPGLAYGIWLQVTWGRFRLGWIPPTDGA